MELADAIRKRHMVRSFSGTPVEHRQLEQVISAALSSPSAGNTDGWDAVVLQGDQATSLFWDATTTPDWRATSRRWPGLSRAPVVICLFSNPTAYLERYDEKDKKASGLGSSDGGEESWDVPFWFVDAGFAALTMLLKATDLQLGGCFLGNFRGENELKAALGVPEDRRYLGAVLLGEAGGRDPRSNSADRKRRSVDEVFHAGSW